MEPLEIYLSTEYVQFKFKFNCSWLKTRYVSHALLLIENKVLAGDLSCFPSVSQQSPDLAQVWDARSEPEI